jgi:uncharacterized lipoprotein
MKIILTFLSLILLAHCQIDPELMKQAQGVSYQSIRQKAKEDLEPKITEEAKKTETIKDQSHLYTPPEEEKLEPEVEGPATSPVIVGKFWCDPDYKTNTVRHEVMTNKNYNK